jgi:hypothetical protein
MLVIRACDQSYHGRMMSKTSDHQPAHEPASFAAGFVGDWIDRNDAQSQFEHRGPLSSRLKGRPAIFDD